MNFQKRGARIQVSPAEDRTKDGIVFASKREMNRYCELLMHERIKVIRDLRLQVPFVVLVNQQKICTYRADFVYLDQGGRQVVEDSKGMRTEIYKLKKKLVEAQYGIRILET